MFQVVTCEALEASLRSLAAGEKPAIDAGLLARLLPPFSGVDDSALSPASIEHIGRQWRFHAEAVVSWGVLGRGEEFVLIPLGPADEWEAAMPQRDAATRAGLWYCGVIGLASDGTPMVLAEPEPTAECLTTLLHACVHGLWPHALARTAHGQGYQAVGDSAAWLLGLWSLNDPRPTPGGTLPN